MKELRFGGYSDDTFGEDTPRGDDYDNCASGKPIVFQIKSGGEGLNIVGQYAGNDWQRWMPGCWLIGIQQMEEGIPIPNWSIRFETGKSGYTPILIIEVPDDAELICLNRQ